ncbi:MAG: DsrE family protein, partial [Longimicrobiales bacterium]|nr:DsrE family protein [Longimicrobiales bacterium]
TVFLAGALSLLLLSGFRLKTPTPLEQEPSRLAVLWTSGDPEVATKVALMAEVGVEIVACKACADSYGVSDVLEGLGIEVKYMGQPLTEILKGDWKVLTF